MTSTRPLRSCSLALMLTLSACGGQALDVGSNGAGSSSGSSSGSGAVNGGTAGQGGSGAGGKTISKGKAGGYSCPEPPDGSPLEPWPDPTCEGGTTPLQGTWSGYVQGSGAGRYPDMGNLTITLGGDDEALCGTVTFGPPEPLAPATDPEANYPPGYEAAEVLVPVAGFSYTLMNPSLSGSRVQFQIVLSEPFQSWCQLQTPIYTHSTNTGWSCTPNATTQHTAQGCRQVDECTGEEVFVPCDQFDTCLNIEPRCACNSSGCDADISSRVYAFDLRFEADDATGAMDESVTIILQR